MKKALVYGLGRSGRAAADLLVKRGYSVEGLDKEDQEVACPFPCTLVEDFKVFDGYDMVVISPGIPFSDTIIQQFVRLGVEVIGEAELGLSNIKNRVIAITGTNGKSSVVSLLVHILKSAKMDAIALGNIGKPLTEVALELDPHTLVVAELSSYQLETMKGRSLDIAAILEITPDHLERYTSFDHYRQTKCKIEDCLKQGGLLFSIEGHPYLKKIEKIGENVGNIASLINWRGISSKALDVVIAISIHLSISSSKIIEAIESYKSLPHRVEFIDAFGGVKFYNDSKSTNIDSTIFAVKQFDHPIILLVGGRGKGDNYALWKESFASNIKKVIAFGEVSDRIVEDLEKCVLIEKRPCLRSALRAAVAIAEKGDTVLLSPGCASFDAFDNYEHRGREFIKGVFDESQRYRFGSLYD